MNTLLSVENRLWVKLNCIKCNQLENKCLELTVIFDDIKNIFLMIDYLKPFVYQGSLIKLKEIGKLYQNFRIVHLNYICSNKLIITLGWVV